MVEQGLFREDLYYRLNVIAIEIPPLRERKDDIPVLARSFIRRFSGDLKKRIEELDPQAEKTLVRYNWPGNIRELENTIERAVLLAEGPTIATDDLRIGELSTTTTAAREAVSTVRIPPTGYSAGRRRTPSGAGGAPDVELDTEGRRRTPLDQPPRDELQDQDPGYRAAACPRFAADRRGLNTTATPSGGLCDIAPRGEPHQRAYTAASWSASHGRAAPESRANLLRGTTGVSRSCVGARGD